MRRGVAIVAGAALAALVWPGEAFAGLVVRTDRPDRTVTYWIIRNEDWKREMSAPGAQLRRVLERYGRRPINGLQLRTKPRVTYLIYAECNGQPRRPPSLADGGQPNVTVNC